MKSLLSVIVPIYNSEKFLEKCINSLISQSYKYLDIILINDGSTDGSGNICKKYEMIDERIHVIEKANSGVSKTRNIGLDKAVGEFITFVDSDDYIDSKMYEVMMSEFDSQDIDIVECGYKSVNQQGVETVYELTNEVIVGSYACLQHYLVGKNCKNFNWNKIFKKELFRGLKYPSIRYSEDYWMNIYLFERCRKKKTVSNAFYFYLQHTESACHQFLPNERIKTIEMMKMVNSYIGEKYSKLAIHTKYYILNQIIALYIDIERFDKTMKSEEQLLIDDYIRYFKPLNDYLKNYSLKKVLRLMLFKSMPSIYVYLKLKGKK